MTAPWACSASWPPSSSAPNGSSRSAGTPTGKHSHGSSAPPTSSKSGDDGVERIKDLTNGLGAHSVIEAVGTHEAMMQAIHSTRPGGYVGFVGVSHDVAIPGDELFSVGVHIHGGPAPVRQYLPHLIKLIWSRAIDPGRVFDLTLPLEQAADGYRAMDQRTAIKVLLIP